jgi:hypothetical protein
MKSLKDKIDRFNAEICFWGEEEHADIHTLILLWDLNKKINMNIILEIRSLLINDLYKNEKL